MNQEVKKRGFDTVVQIGNCRVKVLRVSKDDATEVNSVAYDIPLNENISILSDYQYEQIQLKGSYPHHSYALTLNNGTLYQDEAGVDTPFITVAELEAVLLAERDACRCCQ